MRCDKRRASGACPTHAAESRRSRLLAGPREPSQRTPAGNRLRQSKNHHLHAEPSGSAAARRLAAAARSGRSPVRGRRLLRAQCGLSDRYVLGRDSALLTHPFSLLSSQPVVPRFSQHATGVLRKRLGANLPTSGQPAWNLLRESASGLPAGLTKTGTAFFIRPK